MILVKILLLVLLTVLPLAALGPLLGMAAARKHWSAFAALSVTAFAGMIAYSAFIVVPVIEWVAG